MKVKGFMLVGVLLAHLTMFAQQNGSYVQSGYREKIDLSGKWLFQLDPDSTLKPTSKFNDVIYLPGTTDTNRKGNAATKKDETTHLTRKYSYVGKAWYQVPVRIPKSWKGQQIVLYMERTKPTTVYVDGKPAGSNNDISTPQEYILSKQLKPGVHYITVMVDNSEKTVPPQIISNSHAYTEDTQTNWNGIIGRIYLEKRAPTHIDNLIITTDSERKEVQVTVNIDGQLKADTKMKFILIPWGGDYGYVIGEKMVPKTQNAFTHARVIYRDDSLKLWSEHHPSLYRIHVTIDGYDEMEKTFGVRSFTTQGTQFAINGNTTFLRGKHDACVFPLTGHVPMTMEEWRRYFQICKGYGINHVRFHSWCPPEACFLAADIEGIYLQPELPFWGDFNKDDRRLMDFLMKEGTRIITTYGHHPSFVMMALGNELWGDIPTMQLFTKAFKKMDPTKLFTFGSNYYLGYQGWKEGMDFFVTCRNGGEEFVGMTEYNSDTHVPEHRLVQPVEFSETLNKFLGERGVSELAVSETVKFGHVTYYFNGNSYDKAPGEEHMRIDSYTEPFETRPWMRTAEITDEVIKNLDKYKFVRLNYPGGDMVGHTADMEATIVAMEAIDLSLARIAKKVDELGGCLVIVADHGNAEELLDASGERKTSHTINKVPCIIYDNTANSNKYQLALVVSPGLANVAATVAVLLGQNDYPASWNKPLIEIK